MTWTKLGSEFPEDCSGLTDAAYRTHCDAIAWLYRRERTTLRIDHAELAHVSWSPDWETGVKELVAARFWKTTPDGYQVTHHADVIRASLAAQLAQRTRNARAQRAKRQRTSASDNPAPPVSADISAYVTGDVSAGVSAAARTEQTSSTNAAMQLPVQATRERAQQPACTACSTPARHGCQTCWEHARLDLDTG